MVEHVMLKKAAERIEELSAENAELVAQHAEMQKYVEVLQFELERTKKQLKKSRPTLCWN